MSNFLLDNVSVIRLGAFGGVLAAMALWEAAAPCRKLSFRRLQRWPSNLAIVLLDTVAVRLLVPASLAAIAALAAERGWGLFNARATPALVSGIASVVLLDLAIYGQHVAFHAIPMLWRVHRMHHSDLDFDVTTGIRFHPIEILLSVLIKMAVVLVLGAPVVAVLTFEVLLNATSMFSHSNTKLVPRLDTLLRTVLVTPDMHRVHHSVVRAEANSNFGFNLSLWDRLFGTYRREPVAGQLGMTIGIETFREVEELRLDRMLTQPFRAQSSTALPKPQPAATTEE